MHFAHTLLPSLSSVWLFGGKVLRLFLSTYSSLVVIGLFFSLMFAFSDSVGSSINFESIGLGLVVSGFGVEFNEESFLTGDGEVIVFSAWTSFVSSSSDSLSIFGIVWF